MTPPEEAAWEGRGVVVRVRLVRVVLVRVSMRDRRERVGWVDDDGSVLGGRMDHE